MLLKYLWETGAIVGAWESNTLELLEAQRVDGDPVYGYLLSTLDLAPNTVEEDYVVVDGALVERPVTREGQ